MIRALSIAILICLAGSTARAVDPKYLPADTEIVITLNVKQLLASELVKSHQAVEHLRAGLHANVPGGEEALKHLKQIGFDPLQDLHSVTVAMPPSKDPEAAFVILEGNFNAAKIKSTAEQLAKEKGDVIKITQAGAQTIFEITPPAEKKVFIALAGDKILLVSLISKQNLTEALGRGAPVAKKQILDLLATTNPTQTASFVMTGSALVKLSEDLPVPVQGADATLKAMTGITGALTVNKDVKFQLGVGMGDEATAKKLAEAANGGLFMVKGLAQQQIKDTPELAPVGDILNTLKVGAEATAVVLRGEISAEVMRKLPELKKYIPIP